MDKNSKNNNEPLPRLKMARRKFLLEGLAAGLIGAAAASKPAKAEPGGTWATPTPGDSDPSQPDYTPLAITTSLLVVDEVTPDYWLYSVGYIDASGDTYVTNGREGVVILNNGPVVAFDFTATVEGYDHGREDGVHVHQYMMYADGSRAQTQIDEGMIPRMAFVAIDAQARISNAVKNANINGISPHKVRLTDDSGNAGPDDLLVSPLMLDQIRNFAPGLPQEVLLRRIAPPPIYGYGYGPQP